MKYIQIPEPFVLKNYLTDEPLKGIDGSLETVTFARSIRWALAAAQTRQGGPGAQQPDMLQLLDIRKLFDTAKVGTTVEVRDGEYEMLRAEFTRPNANVFPPVWGFSAESHIRAVVEAKSELPAVMKSAANGSATEQTAS